MTRTRRPKISTRKCPGTSRRSARPPTPARTSTKKPAAGSRPRRLRARASATDASAGAAGGRGARGRESKAPAPESGAAPIAAHSDDEREPPVGGTDAETETEFGGPEVP